jgi:hypothetical protein
MTNAVAAPTRAEDISIIVLLMAAVLTILSGAITWWALTPSHEEIELKTALVRIRAASAQGMGLNSFADLVLEARTRFELARPHLNTKQLKESDEAVADWEAVKAIWQETLEGTGRVCPAGCLELYDPLKQLGLVKDAKDFETFQKKPENHWGAASSSGPGRELISRGLTVSKAATDIAILGL